MNSASTKSGWIAAAAFGAGVFMGFAFFGDATKFLSRLLISGALAGAGLGVLGRSAWNKVFAALVIPAFLSAALVAMLMHGVFDKDYAAHFMYEDLSWLPLILIFYGVPTIGVFLGADAVLTTMRRLLLR